MAVSAFLRLQHMLQALKSVFDPMPLEGHYVHTLYIRAAGLRTCLGAMQSTVVQTATSVPYFHARVHSAAYNLCTCTSAGSQEAPPPA